MCKAASSNHVGVSADTDHHDRRLLLIGYGVVGSCFLDFLQQEFSFTDVIVLDRKSPDQLVDFPTTIARYQQETLTEDNYARILSNYLNAGDVCVNLSVVGSQDLLIWCQENDVLYLDTSGEEWEDTEGSDAVSFSDRNKQEKFSLSAIQKSLATKIKALRESHPGKKSWPTAALYHGMNPGLVNHFMKQGLLDVAEAVLKLDHAQNREEIIAARQAGDFARLSQALGVKTIHVSERDTQVSNRPRLPKEFASTWSVEGFLVELEQYSELVLGTHERTIPADATTWNDGQELSVALGSKGANTRVFSWVPSGTTLGFLTPHDEVLTMGNFLTVRNGEGELKYRPTVLFSYMPCDLSVASVNEFVMQGYNREMKEVFMGADQIVGGRDEVGVLLLGHQLGAWWTGSTLSHEEAQQIHPRHNATAIQVAGGVVSSLHWMLSNPKEGVRIPEEIPHGEILKKAGRYIGTLVSQHADFNPSNRTMLHFFDHEDKFGPIDGKDWMPSDEQKWQFAAFLHGPRRLAPSPYFVPLSPAELLSVKSTTTTEQQQGEVRKQEDLRRQQQEEQRAQDAQALQRGQEEPQDDQFGTSPSSLFRGMPIEMAESVHEWATQLVEEAKA